MAGFSRSSMFLVKKWIVSEKGTKEKKEHVEVIVEDYQE